jgi:hypothetical protein
MQPGNIASGFQPYGAQNQALAASLPSAQNLAMFAAPQGMTPAQVGQLAMAVGNAGAQSTLRQSATGGSLGPLLQAIFAQPNAPTAQVPGQTPAQSPYAAPPPTPASIAAARAAPPVAAATAAPAAPPPAPSGNPMDPYSNVTPHE